MYVEAIMSWPTSNTSKTQNTGGQKQNIKRPTESHLMTNSSRNFKEIGESKSKKYSSFVRVLIYKFSPSSKTLTKLNRVFVITASN